MRQQGRALSSPHAGPSPPLPRNTGPPAASALARSRPMVLTSAIDAPSGGSQHHHPGTSMPSRGVHPITIRPPPSPPPCAAMDCVPHPCSTGPPTAHASDPTSPTRSCLCSGCAVPARGFAEKVRLSGVDTPEVSRPRREAKRIAGSRAKERLASSIRGPSVEIVCGQDRPLRPDARDPAGAGKQGRDDPATGGAGRGRPARAEGVGGAGGSLVSAGPRMRLKRPNNEGRRGAGRIPQPRCRASVAGPCQSAPNTAISTQSTGRSSRR